MTDGDEVLTTGGIDAFACLNQDEAAPWTAVAPTNLVRVGWALRPEAGRAPWLTGRRP